MSYIHMKILEERQRRVAEGSRKLPHVPPVMGTLCESSRFPSWSPSHVRHAQVPLWGCSIWDVSDWFFLLLPMILKCWGVGRGVHVPSCWCSTCSHDSLWPLEYGSGHIPVLRGTDAPRPPSYVPPEDHEFLEFKGERGDRCHRPESSLSLQQEPPCWAQPRQPSHSPPQTWVCEHGHGVRWVRAGLLCGGIEATADQHRQAKWLPWGHTAIKQEPCNFLT